MIKTFLESYLAITGAKFTNINEFWAYLLNDTQGKICQILLNNGYKKLADLKPYLKNKG